MAKKATAKEKFWSIAIILSLPVLLYVSDFFGVIISNHLLWIPVYLLGVVPAIIAELLTSQTALFVRVPEYIPVVYSILQLCFAFIIAGVAKLNTVSKIEFGVFRIDRNQNIHNLLRVLLYFYAMAFTLYCAISVISFLISN